MDYFIALFGWLLYLSFSLKMDKEAYDKEQKQFNFKPWFFNNWDNWLFTLLCAPVLVWYLDDIVGLINYWFKWDLPVFEVYYLFCGVLTEVIYAAGAKMATILKAIKS